MDNEYLKNMVANVASNNSVEAHKDFVYAINQKINDRVEAARIEVAKGMINTGNSHEDVQTDSE